MPFPTFVRTVVSSIDEEAWPVEGQGWNECGCTAASNALNLLVRSRQYRKDDFVRQAGLFFQPQWGGTPSPITTWLLQRHGFGTHFGNLQDAEYELVLRDLIDRGIPVIIELGVVLMGGVAVSGQHSVVLVGYSEPYRDHAGQLCEEYYLVDAQWRELGKFKLAENNRDYNGDGVVEQFPGNRTLSRQQLRAEYPMRTYFPVFPTQSDHDQWYRAHVQVERRLPLLSALTGTLITGAHDRWVGPRRALAPLPG